MSYLKNSIVVVFLLIMIGMQPIKAENTTDDKKTESSQIDVKGLILGHISDSYNWHITDTPSGKHVAIPLPVIVKGMNGWHVFLSSALETEAVEHGEALAVGNDVFYISKSDKYNGKLVEKSATGEEIRPLDLSITKTVCALLINCLLLLVLILSVSKWYNKRHKQGVIEAPGGFVGFMELMIMDINDELIKPCIGKGYEKYAPYLLTVFFFIFLNNLMGLIPVFPAGANTTGNIAITMVLALFTFVIVNVSGTKEYWREIFWPDVPTWLKVPAPIMPLIELVGVFTKPFALMVRLFANILAGHSIILGITCLIFVTVNLGPAMHGTMSVVSVVLSIFLSLVEILVAYIQAYVFTMLSAVFIGLARVEPHGVGGKH